MRINDSVPTDKMCSAEEQDGELRPRRLTPQEAAIVAGKRGQEAMKNRLDKMRRGEWVREV